MKRKVPLAATLVVLVAVGIMVRLGLWQVDRLHQKQAILAQYAAAQADRTVRPWPAAGSAVVPYSLVGADCLLGGRSAPVAGQNGAREAGWAHVAPCALADGTEVSVVLGWSSQPEPVTWPGGAVTGTFVPHDKTRPRIIAAPPLAGLAANARPDPRSLPNNHLAYAVQWFAFAFVALVIYGLALRKRWANVR